jgi:hypothetical protein
MIERSTHHPNMRRIAASTRFATIGEPAIDDRVQEFDHVPAADLLDPPPLPGRNDIAVQEPLGLPPA